MVPPHNPVWKLKVSGTAKLVYLAIAGFAQMATGAWPSIKTLAKMTGCSQRTVQRAIRELDNANLIKVSQRKAGNGVSLSNCYLMVGGHIDTLGSHNDGVGCHPDTGGGCQNDIRISTTTNNNKAAVDGSLVRQSDTLPVQHAGSSNSLAPKESPGVLETSGTNSLAPNNSGDLETSGNPSTIQGKLRSSKELAAVVNQNAELTDHFIAQLNLSPSDSFRQALRTSAGFILGRHPLDEAKNLITWISQDEQRAKEIGSLFDLKQRYDEILAESKRRQPQLSAHDRIQTEYFAKNGHRTIEDLMDDPWMTR